MSIFVTSKMRCHKNRSPTWSAHPCERICTDCCPEELCNTLPKSMSNLTSEETIWVLKNDITRRARGKKGNDVAANEATCHSHIVTDIRNRPQCQLTALQQIPANCRHVSRNSRLLESGEMMIYLHVAYSQAFPSSRIKTCR